MRLPAALCLAACAALRAVAYEAHAPPIPAHLIKEDLYDAEFLSPTEGWMVGTFGSVFHTADGGRSWRSQSAPDSKNLFAVEAVTATEAWAVGDWGAPEAVDTSGVSPRGIGRGLSI